MWKVPQRSSIHRLQSSECSRLNFHVGHLVAECIVFIITLITFKEKYNFEAVFAAVGRQKRRLLETYFKSNIIQFFLHWRPRPRPEMKAKKTNDCKLTNGSIQTLSTSECKKFWSFCSKYIPARDCAPRPRKVAPRPRPEPPLWSFALPELRFWKQNNMEGTFDSERKIKKCVHERHKPKLQPSNSNMPAPLIIKPGRETAERHSQLCGRWPRLMREKPRNVSSCNKKKNSFVN